MMMVLATLCNHVQRNFHKSAIQSAVLAIHAYAGMAIWWPY